MALRGEPRGPRSLKELRVRRGQLRAVITRFADFLERVTDFSDPKAREIPARKLKVEQAFADLEDIQVEIELLEEEDPDELLTDRLSVEDKYYAALSRAASFLEPPGSPAHSTAFASGRSDPELSSNESGSRGLSRRASINVRLPQLTIPEFAGAYEQWAAFYDTFRTLIHNNEALNDVQRFHYLVSALKGDAAQVISSIEITSANYSLAWELLRKRFENKKAIIRNHIKNLFELPSVAKDSHGSLRQFSDSFLKNFRALRNLGEPVDEWNTILIYLLSSKLDANSKREWERSTYTQISPAIDTFISFLTSRCQLLEALDTKIVQTTGYSHNTSRRFCDPRAQTHVSVTNDSNSKAKASAGCLLCRSQSHQLFRCEEFLRLAVQARIRTVRKVKACINCLRKGHNAQDCYYGPCRNCGKKHNTLLHLGRAGHSGGGTSASAQGGPQTAGSSEEGSAATSSHQGGAVATHSISSSFVLLSTARVILSNERGGAISCRALLDNGSQSCFITSEACQKLNLNVNKTRLPVTGINGVLTSIKGRAHATVKSMVGRFQRQLEFLVLDKITEKIPQLRFEAELLCVPQGMQLADPSFNEPGAIDILLGASIFFELLLEGQMKAAREGPILQNSKMGWIVSGALNLPNAATRVCHVAQSCEVAQNSDIEQKIERFWAIEEPERLTNNNFSKEESEVEEHFCQTHSRMPTGRFIVRLPTRENVTQLGNNLYNATRRFYALERKLQGDPKLRTSYSDFMREYIKLGHMSRIDVDAERGAGVRYYLPHHAVVKATSITTKVRVVFDASCKSESGLSLNDVLKTGPCIQVDIFAALLRFRAHNVAFTADIAKMYRQFEVHDHDRALQRIVWRFDPLESLEHYQLNTVTYGTAPASFLATRCLRQLALENWAHCPDASAAIDREFYMDDWIGGAPDAQSAIELIRKVTTILESAGLELRQWVSNDTVVLESAAAVASKLEYSVKSDQGSSKTLGINWNAPRDALGFNTAPPICGRPTKRSILSAIAQIFDPLGLLGPVILTAKLIMQDLWKIKTGWDEPVDAGIQAKWVKFSKGINTLNEVAVPRQFAMRGCSRIELHGFCDASQVGYGACIYARSVNQGTGEVAVRLVCSKSRVAPLKVVSLPRLELCGTLLGAQLMQRVVVSLNVEVKEMVLWCDSTIALAWISAESSRFKVFVANRVSQIQKLTRDCQWRYIPGRINPADFISRGVAPHEIHHLGSWWKGPEFLAKEPRLWPPPPGAISEALPELRQASLVAMTAPQEAWLLTRYSSLRRLTRICAYLRRFGHNCRQPADRRLSGELSSDELDGSIEAIVKLVQGQVYGVEIKSIRQTGGVAKSSKLSDLRPFLDSAQVLRVGGRLLKASLPFNRKHPMILPARHHVTTLVILQEHLRNLHAGAQTVLMAIRAKFWPLNGRQTVKAVLRNCMTCFKVKPRYLTQCMGQLPADRVNPARPFTNCGIDYAGPYLVKTRQCRNKTLTKAYICIFVCFATKAVHIELVSDLTSEGFLNALKRFVARRGICQRVYSDNATNFVGAKRQLARFLELATEPDLRRYLSEQRIEWRFIPPRSPHFGGLWESAVRCTKYHLKRIISNVPLTFEGLYTYLTQIEAVLNSRPLCALTDDPEDLEALTPGHFLIGSALTGLPEAPASEDGRGYRDRYEHLRLLVQQFWKRWSKGYLHSLQQCTKWRQSNVPEQLKGSLALLHEDGTPPMRWRLGRVIDTHPGPDGRVRVVTLRTRDGNFKRAVARISLLPIEPL